MKGPTHYDIIGDVHGRFDKLSALMRRMNYRIRGPGFVPPAGHKALFLGDLIDPKPGHESPGGVRATLHAVKAMVDAGDAFCLMGNHELNAIYFHSRGPDGQWLRSRGDKNVRMHTGTLADFPDYEDPAGEWLSLWLPWSAIEKPATAGFHLPTTRWERDCGGWNGGLAYCCRPAPRT